MKYTPFYLFAILFSLINVCDYNGPVNGPEINYIGFDHSDCLNGENGLLKSAATCLQNWRYDNDILTLYLHYTANCCPDFKDSVAMDYERIDLYLYDKISACDCYCEYNADFSFVYPSPGKTRVLFHFKETNSIEYTTQLDTVIVVQ